MANISPFELTEAFTMENFNKRIQTANTEINNLDTKINNLDTNKQNKDTAITTANIGSQNVNYANSAGNADTVDGYHADGLIAAASAAASSLVFGTYTGDSAKSRSFNLGFAPKAVFVCSQEGVAGYLWEKIGSYGGLALPGAPVTLEGDEVVIVTDTGFSINAPNDYCRVNQKGNIYRYFAVK